MDFLILQELINVVSGIVRSSIYWNSTSTHEPSLQNNYRSYSAENAKIPTDMALQTPSPLNWSSLFSSDSVSQNRILELQSHIIFISVTLNGKIVLIWIQKTIHY